MYFDLIFILLTTFCLCFAWARYFIHNNLICLFLSILTTVLCFLCIKRLFFSKKYKKFVKKQEKNQIEILADYLSFLPEKQVTDLFLQLPQIAGFQPKTSKNTITITDEKVTKKLIFIFENSPLTKSEFCRITKNNKADMIEIFATDFQKDLPQLANKCPQRIRFFDKTDVYFLLKNADVLPDLQREKSKLKSEFWYIVFNKSRAKYYLSSAIFLILTSFLTFFPLYYVISGTILFFVAIYAKFNVKFNLPTTKKEI